MANIMAAQFSIYGSAGLSGLTYKSEGDVSSEVGFGAGMGYAFDIGGTETSVWKTGLAIEIATYKNNVLFGTLSEENDIGSGTGKFRFTYLMDGYEEIQNLTMVSIPITIQYQAGGKTRFCLSGGVKLGLPISAEATINPGKVTASGDFDHEKQKYINLPQHGFPNGTRLAEVKNSIDLGFSTAATVEMGVLFSKFYLGLYLDYGLNDMHKTKDRHPLEYQTSGSSEPVHNSILNTDLVDNISSNSVGIKMRIQFKR
jgi:hypothetical protein